MSKNNVHLSARKFLAGSSSILLFLFIWQISVSYTNLGDLMPGPVNTPSCSIPFSVFHEYSSLIQPRPLLASP
jgi:hypothetical protein